MKNFLTMLWSAPLESCAFVCGRSGEELLTAAHRNCEAMTNTFDGGQIGETQMEAVEGEWVREWWGMME
jgi:hypothetical protein